MIKVLLVDDESLALEYLENIINWEAYEFKLIGTTTNSEQALRLYKKYKPELVISDVKMPGMNGLELVNIIREYDEKTHILFLSAYKNFDYVKQAIRLGSDDYLLKSDLEEETFLKKLLRIKKEIEKENAKNLYTTGIILEELFKKNISEDKYKMILDENEYIKLYKKYCYIIVAKKIAPKFISEFMPKEKMLENTFEYEFSSICKRCTEDLQMIVKASFPINEEQYLAIIDINADIVAQKSIFDKLYNFASKVFEKMNQIQDQQFEVYYYTGKISVKEFGNIYRENIKQIYERYLKNKIQIVEFKNYIVNEEKENGILSITAEEIINMIEENDQELIKRTLGTIKTIMEKEDFFSYMWYCKNFFEAMRHFEDGVVGKRSGRKFSIVENSGAYDFRVPNKVLDFIEFKVSELVYILSDNDNSEYSKVILNAIKIIQEKYSDIELSSASVAESVNISSAWLSTKFKEEVGINVSDYINDVRVKNAKLLLAKTDLMVYEVSELVGYTSNQYFSKVFKEYIGITPNQYRRGRIK